MTLKEFAEKRNELYDKVPKHLYELGMLEELREWIEKNLKEDMRLLKSQLPDDVLWNFVYREMQHYIGIIEAEQGGYFTNGEIAKMTYEEVEKVKSYR